MKTLSVVPGLHITPYELACHSSRLISKVISQYTAGLHMFMNVVHRYGGGGVGGGARSHD